MAGKKFFLKNTNWAIHVEVKKHKSPIFLTSDLPLYVRYQLKKIVFRDSLLYLKKKILLIFSVMNIIHLEVWELSQKYSMEGDRESVIYWPWECKKL